jgi:hypothetical protein
MKNYRIFVGILALALVFGFAACEGPVGPAGSGTPGVGTSGTTYLAGTQDTAVIQHAIDAGGPLVLAAVTQGDTDTLIIPAGRGVKILGAFTTDTGGVLVIGDASSVDLTQGNVVSDTGNILITSQALIDAGKLGGSGTLLPYAIASSITDGTIPVTATAGGATALYGNVNVKTAGAAPGEISVSEFSGKNVFILGNLTVTNAVTATSVNVLGSVSASGEITGLLNASGAVTFTGAQTALTGLNTDASVTSTKAISSSGDIGVKGNLTLTGATADGALTASGTAKLEVGGNVSAASVTTGSGIFTVGGNLSAGDVTLGTATTNALTVAGVATITGDLGAGTANTAIILVKGGSIGGAVDLGATSASLTSNGPLTITGILTSTSATTLAGTGAITLSAVPVITSGLVVTNTAGVTLPSFVGVSGQAINASAGKVTFGTAADYITVTKGTLTCEVGVATIYSAANKALELANLADLTLVDEGAITVGGAAKITLLNSTIGAGTYTAADSVKIQAKTAGDEITVALGGTGTQATSGLLLGEDGLLLSANVNSSAAVYTLVDSVTASNPVVLSGKDITVPAEAAAALGAKLVGDAVAQIVLGEGKIILGRKTSGAGAGQLALTASAKIGPFAGSPTGDKIPASADLAHADDAVAAQLTNNTTATAGVFMVGSNINALFGANGAVGEATISAAIELE